MKKLTVMILAVMAVMPSVSTAHMSDISGEVSTETMLPLGNIKSDWGDGTEKELMDLLRTKDQVLILRIMKKLCMDKLDGNGLWEILLAIKVSQVSDSHPHYPPIYLFYRAGKFAQAQQKVEGTVYGWAVARWVRDLCYDMRKENPNPTKTEFKLMEEEALNYIFSL